jgi:C4-dicarboxylate transporter DctQ subunit
MPRVHLAVILCRLVVAVAITLLGLLVVATLLQVVSRYILRQPLDWTEETARYVFVWLAMIGAGIAARDRMHFFVDVFLEWLPRRLRRVAAIGTGLASTAFLLVVSWAAINLALGNAIQDSPVLMVPMSLPYFAIPVGLVLMALFSLGETVRHLRRSEGGPEAQHGETPPSPREGV